MNSPRLNAGGGQRLHLADLPHKQLILLHHQRHLPPTLPQHLPALRAEVVASAQGGGPDGSKVEAGVEKAREWVVGKLTG